MKKFLLLSALALALANTGTAQTQKVVADKIVAQIGDDIILKSDIDEGVRQYQSSPDYTNLPADLDCQLLKSQIMTKALAIQAQRDSLPISDDDVDMAFQNRINYMLGQFGGSREKLEQAIGKSIDQIRQEWGPDLRTRVLAGKMQHEIGQNVTITPAEVLAYYNQIPKDSLRFYESEFEASQIVMYPNPNTDVVNYIKNELEDWKKQVESGKANFAALAKLYSDEPNAKETGGQLSMNRDQDKGHYDPDFMAAAFRLREGQISPVVKSQMGYHIIQMVSRAGNDAIVRHIIKIPPVTDVEIKATTKSLDSLRTLLVENKATFSEAFARFNEDKDAKFNAGAITGGTPYNPITPFTIDEMQNKDLATLIPTLKVGEYSQPQVFTDINGRQGVRLVYLRTRTDPHRENMKDDYDKIAQRALAVKQQDVLDAWLTSHMKDFYIQIDPRYGHCLELVQWMKNSNDKVEHYSTPASINKN